MKGKMSGVEEGLWRNIFLAKSNREQSSMHVWLFEETSVDQKCLVGDAARQLF